MSQQGYSLVGFMDAAAGVSYLRDRCDLPGSSDDALRDSWESARRRLGAPIADAGVPDIRPLPAGHEGHLEGVRRNPRFDTTLEGMPYDFAEVEIRRLLAFQFHVERERAGRFRTLVGDRSLNALLAFTLPHGLEEIKYKQFAQPSGVLITSGSLNLRTMLSGLLAVPEQAMQMAGPLFGAASPLTQVVHFRDRYYLKNGYHRAHFLLAEGITHMPALVLEASNFAQVGAPGGAATFNRDLLESDNPPTCGHLTPERAWRVPLKQMRRVISVSWTEYAVADEG